MINDFLAHAWSHYKAINNKFYCISTKTIQGKFRDNFFTNIEEASSFVETVKNKCNVYFCPNVFSQKQRRKSYVLPSKTLYADLDKVNPKECLPRPSIAWQSSPNRYAAIWFLSNELAVPDFEELNRKLAYRIGADKSGWDSVQVLRMPGTQNFKYPSRPVAKVLYIGSQCYSPRDLGPTIKEETLRLLDQKSHGNQDRSAMLYRLECELREQGLSKEEIFKLVKPTVWNKFKGRRGEDTQLRTEIDKVFNGTTVKVHEYGDLICFADIQEKEITWLWKPYFPQGKLVVVEGDPGEGKSWLSLALVAAVSRGNKILDCQMPVGNCLILNAEDDAEDTIKPRLRVLGADFNKIFMPPGLLSFEELDDLEYMKSKFEQYKPVLAVIDPLVAYMGHKIDMFKANQTRYIMARLKVLADICRTTIVCVRHLTKSSREKSIYRGQGSIDITGAARSQLMIGPSPTDEHSKIVCQLKLSAGARKGKPIKYYLGADGSFEWIGYVDFQSEDWFKEKKVKLVDKAKPSVVLENGKIKQLPN